MKKKINRIKENLTKEEINHYEQQVKNFSETQYWDKYRETEYLRDYSGRLAMKLAIHENLGLPYELSCTKKAQLKYGGTIEILVPGVGRIDLLTRFQGVDYMVEAKNIRDWKHAIGQILCYNHCFENGRHAYQPAIALLKQRYTRDVSIAKVLDMCYTYGITPFYLSRNGELERIEL